MPCSHPLSAASPGARGGPAFLVLGLLVGLLAMHGLAPGPGVPPYTGRAAAEHVSPAGVGHAAGAGHARAVGGPDAAHTHPQGGGHAEHADADCAAASLGAGPQVADAAGAVVGEVARRAGTARVPARGPGPRAPPSLSDLQLLRI